jgi:hypothetical protein
MSAMAVQAWHKKVKAIVLYDRMVYISKKKISEAYVNGVSEVCEYGGGSMV